MNGRATPDQGPAPRTPATAANDWNATFVRSDTRVMLTPEPRLLDARHRFDTMPRRPVTAWYRMSGCAPVTGHLRCARSCRTHTRVLVRSIRHRGLRQLVENNSFRLLKQDLVERVRGIVTALAIAETMEGFVREAAPGWRVHRLSGERRNEWSVSVSANWRITFEERDGMIERLNLEDYH